MIPREDTTTPVVLQFSPAAPRLSRSRLARAAAWAAGAAAGTALFAWACGLRVEPAYRYDGAEVEAAARPLPGGAESASLGGIPSKARNAYSYAADFGSPRDMLAVRIAGADPENPPAITVVADGKRYPLQADEAAGGPDGDAIIAAGPVFPENPVSHAEAEVDWGGSAPGAVTLVGTDTSAHGWKLAAGPKAAANASDGVVTRAEWGADEELRFADTDAWKKILADNAKRKPTAAQKKAAEKSLRIYNWLRDTYPQEFTGSVKYKEENGRPLAWPVERSGLMDKVVVHHTGEWTDAADGKPRDEKAVMRGIYYYHARVRQWGDIGYNFVVGKSGTVYEGRAGGDYAVAAHAVWNNSTSVGVSLMGAYDRETPPREQMAGLVNVLSVLSKRYGIDFSAKRTGHRECTNWKCPTDGETVDAYGLAGHRDVGHTNCPGANLYPFVAKIRLAETFSHGREPVPRPGSGLPGDVLLAKAAEPAPRGDFAEPQSPSVAAKLASAAESTFSSEAAASPAPSAAPESEAYGVDERTVRIKLSVPDLAQLKISPADGGKMSLAAGKKSAESSKFLTFKRKGKKDIAVSLGGKTADLTGPVRLSGGVLAIDSWSRKPGWDKTGKLNDNQFRGTLELRNEDGKWLVVNELPLGQYLKGLGEVSEGDPEHKAKTIIVAARTYAAWYLRAENRKFPGKPYDGSDDPAVFQRYLGYGLEKRSPTLSKYADETADTVILYRGKLIKPWYFNSSTGRTRSAKEYCERNGGKNCPDTPWLQSVKDPGTATKAYNGHGVGISGNGATALANAGKTFPEIIRYFLSGTEILQLK